MAYNLGGKSGGSLNMNQLLKQAQKMQEEVQKSQSEIAGKTFESTAGGGAIKVVVGGDKVIKEVSLKKDIVDKDDVPMLQDLIILCTNDALKKVDEATSQELGKYNIPGLKL